MSPISLLNGKNPGDKSFVKECTFKIVSSKTDLFIPEVIPTSSLQPFRYGTVQAGLGSLLRGLDEEGEKPPYASHEKGVPNQFRVYCARVYGICRNARA